MILCSVPLTEEEKSNMNLINDKIIFVDEIDAESIPYEKIDIFITFGYDIENSALDKMHNLQWIHIFQTGIEHIAINEILRRNIILTHTKDVHGIPISEYVLSMILYTVRDLPRYIDSKNAKLWDRRPPLIEEAYGKTVSIFGTGSIGSEIAKLLQSLNMNVIGVNTTGKPKKFFDKVFKIDEKLKILEKSDFIVLIMPANNETYHTIGRIEFSKMKKNAFLINVGRGSLIDTQSLIDSLKEKIIKGAALDVFEQEPLPNDSPLWDFKNVFITPHIASSTNRYNMRCIKVFKQNYLLYKKDSTLKYQIT